MHNLKKRFPDPSGENAPGSGALKKFDISYWFFLEHGGLEDFDNLQLSAPLHLEALDNNLTEWVRNKRKIRWLHYLLLSKTTFFYSILVSVVDPNQDWGLSIVFFFNFLGPGSRLWFLKSLDPDCDFKNHNKKNTDTCYIKMDKTMKKLPIVD